MGALGVAGQPAGRSGEHGGGHDGERCGGGGSHAATVEHLARCANPRSEAAGDPEAARSVAGQLDGGRDGLRHPGDDGRGGIRVEVGAATDLIGTDGLEGITESSELDQGGVIQEE